MSRQTTRASQEDSYARIRISNLELDRVSLLWQNLLLEQLSCILFAHHRKLVEHALATIVLSATC